MSRLAFWSRIPDGSSLELSMNPAAGNFDMSARMLMDNGQTATFTHQQIASNQAQILLRSPRICTVTFTVRFTGQKATVTLGARIVKPGGGIHGTPFSEPVSGQNGRVEEAAVLAVTRK